MPKYEYDFTSQHVNRLKNPDSISSVINDLNTRATNRGERMVSTFVIGEEVIFVMEREIAEDGVLDTVADKAAEVGSTAYDLATDVAEKTVKGLSDKLGRGFNNLRDKVRRP